MFASEPKLRLRARSQSSAELKSVKSDINAADPMHQDATLNMIWKVCEEELCRRSMADGQYL